MRRAGGAYSRLVVIAKIMLPLVALGLLSTLFLLARSTPPGEPLRYVDEDVADLARSERLGTPRHDAVTSQGTEVRLTADELFPQMGRAGTTEAARPEGIFRTPDGLVYDIVAKRGELDETEGLSTLEGDVTIRTSNGYRLRTEAARLRTDRTYLTSLASVHATGPLGTLDAGRMEVFNTPGAPLEWRAVFTEGVRVVYAPDGG
jgi:lipopolysaccharide export system protein LptC